MLAHIIFRMNYWVLIFKDEFHDPILFAVPAEFILEGTKQVVKGIGSRARGGLRLCFLGESMESLS